MLGFFTGIYLYRINKIDNNIVAKSIDNSINANSVEKSNIVATNNNEEKISPNCTLTLKVYYNKCEHLIEQKQNITEKEVNLTEKELREMFTDWEIQKFTSNEIVLYKEMDEFCDEHYLLKEKDGYVAVYKLDEDNTAKLIKTTDISTDYLTEQDLEDVRIGIKVFTKKELNKTLEDFE